MDYSLPDGTGVEATRAILAENPDCKIIFLTIHDTNEELFAAIRSGAQGYLLKNVSIDKLLDSLRAIQKGEPAFSPTMSSRILEEFTRTSPYNLSQPQNVFTTLTHRETEVLRTMMSGISNQEIADQLFISENTVKRHVHNILVKLNLPNRHAVIEFARDQNFK
jgi:two-component system NarL family response regulator